MNKPDEFKWVRIFYESSSGAARYQDGLGNDIDITAPDNPSAITQLIRNVRDTQPTTRLTRDGELVIPVADYSEVDMGLMDDVSPLVNVVYLPEQEGKPPFQLPFVIRYFGSDNPVLLNRIREAGWYLNNDDVAAYGLDIATYGERTPAKPAIDVLIVDGNALRDPNVFGEISQMLPQLRLLLVTHDKALGEIFYDRYYWERSFLQEFGIAAIFIHYTDGYALNTFAGDLFLNIIHDMPLHEAMYDALRRQPSVDVSATLFASPVSNHYLRLTDALDSFKDRVHDYSKTMSPGSFDFFLQKLSAADPEASNRLVDIFHGNAMGLHGYFQNARTFDMTFRGESTGLVPLSGMNSEFRGKEDLFAKIKTSLQEWVQDDRIVRLIREKQERRVDVTLDELSPFLVYLPIGPTQLLRPGRQYRLNVSIGQLSANTLIAGTTPPIDPLLPDPESGKGHELDIVVFPKDFRLISPSLQRIYLPLLGGTDFARFIIQTPIERQQASLRIAVFYRNVLLQAFLLEASLGENYVFREGAVKVTLDFCTTRKFTNLDELKPRGLYIGVNENPDASHSIFLKKDDVRDEIGGLNEKLIGNAQQELRQLLLNASFSSNGQPKFAPDARPGDELTETFKADVRTFARFGQQYYSKIFHGASKDFRKKMIELRKSANEPITIARHQANFSFPWSMLYDYPLPPEISGASPHPICRGEKLDAWLYKDSICPQGEGCPHNPGLYAYCIDGFWGIRHRIEQLLSTGEAADSRTHIDISGDKHFLFSRNIKDKYAQLLDSVLAAKYPVRNVTSTCNLVEMMWTASSRPVALLVLGHLETDEVAGEPVYPRIITFPKEEWATASGVIPQEKWIYHELLDKRLLNGDLWEEAPFPLIFLITCDNAALNLDSLNSIVQDFKMAGATAIIGTECDITSDLGARFIQEVLDNMYAGDDLGSAIQRFNRDLFKSGVCLAFVFTCYGNLDSTLIR